MTNTEMDMILGSRKFKDLYTKVRAAGMAEQAYVYNLRTDQATNFYGDHGRASGDESDYESYECEDDDDGVEFYGRLQESTLVVVNSVSKEVEKTTFSTWCSHPDDQLEGERHEESTLGKDRLVLSKYKGGIASSGENSISVMAVSGRLILMRHFIDRA